MAKKGRKGGAQKRKSPTQLSPDKSQNWRRRVFEWAFLRDMPKKDRAGAWVARATIIGLVGGGISGWFYLQSQRAELISISAEFIPNPLAFNYPISVATTDKNIGHATAYVSQRITCTRYSFGGQNDPPTDPDYDKCSGEANRHDAIAEGSELKGVFLSDNGSYRATFSREQFDTLSNGQAKFWLYGYVIYGDRYSIPLGDRRMKFCFRYDTSFRNSPVKGFGECEGLSVSYQN